MACRRTRGRFSPFRAGLGVGALGAVAFVLFGPGAPWRTSRIQTGAFLTPLRAPLVERPLLQGVVVDALGRILPGARVTVRPLTEDGCPVPECEEGATIEKDANPRGAFAFTDLGSGIFEVVAQAPGYRPHLQRRVLLGRDQPAVDLRFVLAPEEDGEDGEDPE